MLEDELERSVPGADLVRQAAEEMRRLRRENDALRKICANAVAGGYVPCYYCGQKELLRCPYGFPGCAIADDMA